MTGALREFDGDGSDGRCAECESAIASGPCAACEAMICADCGVFSKDPSGQRVICMSCANLVAKVQARPRRKESPPMRWIAVILMIAFAGLALGLLANCGGSKPKDPWDSDKVTRATKNVKLPVQRRLRIEEPPAGNKPLPGAPVIARIFAFADSQLHYLFGKRTFAQSPFADRMAFEVAVRPAALDDGSDLLLSLFLEEHLAFYKKHSLVFLGDAADLSCQQELDAFTNVLTRLGIETMLPVMSNHDGFYVGNFTSKKDLDGKLEITDMPHDWTRACSKPGSFDDYRLTKGRAVPRLRALLPEAQPWATAATYRGADKPSAHPGAHLYYVRKLSGGDQGATPAWGVFLDTADYRGFDLSDSQGAGSVAAVSEGQLRFLDKAMFEARTLGGDKPTTFVMFGHHPFASMETKSKSRLRSFLEQHADVAAYVVGHAHLSDEKSIKLRNGRVIPEIVVGSTTDSPQAARVIEVQHDPRTRLVAVSSQRLVPDDSLCSAVKPMEKTVLGYTGYRIMRDGTPDLNLGIIEKLLFGLGLSELAAKRAVQTVGALLVENELVRSWAKLYLDSPLKLKREQRDALQAIVDQRYAAGANLEALRPWLRGKVRPQAYNRYDRWYDPVIAQVVGIAALGVHRFGAHHTLFRRLRAKRRASADSRRYFLCHAVHAARAEAQTPRKKNVLFIR